MTTPDATPVVHRVVHRPWGNDASLEESRRFLVKRIVIKPSAA
jgi:mannose-6-phosphate isomerase-like protein (cupin superfamily)